MLKIKEYADSKGITPQVVYKHINKRQKEFQGHIVKQYGVKFLDDEAIAILNSIIRENTLVVADNSKDEEIRRLQEENRRLYEKIESLSDKLIGASDLLLEKSEQEKQNILRISELTIKISSLETRQKKHWWQKKGTD